MERTGGRAVQYGRKMQPVSSAVIKLYLFSNHKTGINVIYPDSEEARYSAVYGDNMDINKMILRKLVL